MHLGRCDVPRCSALNSISIFDASLLWFDKDPDEQLHGYGDYGWIVLLTRDHQVHDLALALLSEIAQRSMRATSKSWLPYYIPPSWKERLNSPDGLDPRSTEVTFRTLVKFAKERDQRPNFLATFMTEPAGRPKGRKKRRSRGPARDTVGFSQADGKLFSKMGRLYRKHGSAYAAALILVDEGRVEGRGGGRESKAKRLAARYLRARRRSIKLAETH
jgi:hypothetical protein